MSENFESHVARTASTAPETKLSGLLAESETSRISVENLLPKDLPAATAKALPEFTLTEVERKALNSAADTLTKTIFDSSAHAVLNPKDLSSRYNVLSMFTETPIEGASYSLDGIARFQVPGPPLRGDFTGGAGLDQAAVRNELVMPAFENALAKGQGKFYKDVTLKIGDLGDGKGGAEIVGNLWVNLKPGFDKGISSTAIDDGASLAARGLSSIGGRGLLVAAGVAGIGYAIARVAGAMDKK